MEEELFEILVDSAGSLTRLAMVVESMAKNSSIRQLNFTMPFGGGMKVYIPWAVRRRPPPADGLPG